MKNRSISEYFSLPAPLRNITTNIGRSFVESQLWSPMQLASQSRTAPIPQLRRNSDVSLNNTREKRSKPRPHFDFFLLDLLAKDLKLLGLIVPLWRRKHRHVLVIYLIYPVMTIKERTLQTAIHLHHHDLISASLLFRLKCITLKIYGAACSINAQGE